jgi:hypothetical protein
MERMEKVIEPPAAPPSSSRDIAVRVTDETLGGANVRFVERGGEVHVSVRTADAELAQTLRGELNDFVGKLEHGGIQAEVWRPGSDASYSQSHSQNGSTDQDSSGRHQAGSGDREQGERNQQKPRWVEELEAFMEKNKATQ